MGVQLLAVVLARFVPAMWTPKGGAWQAMAQPLPSLLVLLHGKDPTRKNLVYVKDKSMISLGMINKYNWDTGADPHRSVQMYTEESLGD